MHKLTEYVEMAATEYLQETDARPGYSHLLSFIRVMKPG